MRHRWFGIVGVFALLPYLMLLAPWGAKVVHAAPKPGALMMSAQVTQHGVLLTLTANTPPAGQIAPTGYVLDRSTSSTGTYVQIATGSFSSGSASYLDTTGTAGSTYYWEASGTAPNGLPSPFSSPVSATFLAQVAGVQVVATPQ
jgi:hypothetical protein